ncbi:MAG: hypothetical protein FRX48_08168 [Lasallia pustulata]|uniref:Uncharacterized protein n=1 Tax=Lasallia pustulata TaxID=136370 RepID=A0A5M8PEN6_9LECA|nr:MAG: hypothetical protein FRX48_08168 [Lasallia pustulata]
MRQPQPSEPGENRLHEYSEYETPTLKDAVIWSGLYYQHQLRHDQLYSLNLANGSTAVTDLPKVRTAPPTGYF